MKCAICEKEGEGFRVELVPVEVLESIEKVTGIRPAADRCFCPPCYGIIQDRWHGAQLILGLYQAHLRAAGVDPAKFLPRLKKLLLG